MKKISIFFLFVGVILAQIKVKAQSGTGIWAATFNTVRTGKKTSIHSDFQWRSTAPLKHTQTVLLRAGLNYHIRKNIVATAGYAFIHNRRLVNNVSGYLPEHRIWEQLLITHRLKPLYLTHRLRLEQRFLPVAVVENNELEKDGHNYANRLRYFIRNVLPFKNEPVFSKGVFAAIQDEVFVNIGNKANVNGEFFDQNRLYLALGYRFNSKVDIDAGYMLQTVVSKGGATGTGRFVQLAGYLRL
jgi:hypothetical protein